MIEFSCAHCGTLLRVSDSMSEKKGKCRECGEVLRIPTATKPTPPTQVVLPRLKFGSDERPPKPIRRPIPPPIESEDSSNEFPTIKKPKQKTSPGTMLVAVIGMAFFFIFLKGGFKNQGYAPPVNQVPVVAVPSYQPPPPVTIAKNRPSTPVDSGKGRKEWFEGATLQHEKISEWRKATSENKLASCGDMIATARTKEKLALDFLARLKSIDDHRPYAEKLMAWIDSQTEKADTDPAIVERDIQDFAVIGMRNMGCLKQPKLPGIPEEKLYEWYEGGGSLQKQKLPEWKKASYQNKLATCGGIIYTLWFTKNFVSNVQTSIGSADDCRTYAEKLVAWIDDASVDAEIDPVKASKNVGTVCYQGVEKMGWTKPQ